MIDPEAPFEALNQSPLYQHAVTVLTYEVPLSADGEIGVSLWSLLMAAIVVLIAFRLSRTAQRLLGERLLGRVPMDSGLAYTLQRLLHYAIVALGLLFALRIGVGLDYTSLAVVATALSVGIGLGLKEIASDVAAGFILLFERPVRVGDRLRLPGDLDIEGHVVSIELRTTKISTFDGTIVIVPNSKLTNEKYINWSYATGTTRIVVPIGVAYGSDLRMVRETLVEATRGVANVASDPAPVAWLKEYGDSSVNFLLHVWASDLTQRLQVLTDVNLRIDELFRERGIQIPFPQRDLHVRSVPGEIVRGMAGSGG